VREQIRDRLRYSDSLTYLKNTPWKQECFANFKVGEKNTQLAELEDQFVTRLKILPGCFRKEKDYILDSKTKTLNGRLFLRVGTWVSTKWFAKSIVTSDFVGLFLQEMCSGLKEALKESGPMYVDEFSLGWSCLLYHCQKKIKQTMKRSNQFQFTNSYPYIVT